MILKINRFDQFGNSVIQLIHLLHVALFYRYNIDIPEHPYFNTNYIMKVINNNECAVQIFERGDNFFKYDSIISNFGKEVLITNYPKILNILKDAFVFNIKDIKILDLTYVVIHIRSGDIFNTHPHPHYVPNPLSYYINILNKIKYNKIILIAENNKNPIINRLLHLYPTIIYKQQSLLTDIKIILGARNIICGYGSFIPSILLFSTNIHNIYSPSYMKFIFLRYPLYQSVNMNDTHVCIHYTDLDDYNLIMKPWTNSKKQIDILLNYS